MMARLVVLTVALVLLAADPAPQWFGIDEPWEPGRIRIRGPLWSSASAHPGRTDRDGCHEVRTEFVYRSGKVAPVGEKHCHRTLDCGLSLDGLETLQDRDDAPAVSPAPPAHPQPRTPRRTP